MEKLGIAITVIWSGIIVGLVVLNREQAMLMSLNEWGDFLAGITAPIAFLWLIIGYMLQRKELNLNTEALLLSKQEIERQANELEKQSAYHAVQASLAEEQRRALSRERLRIWREERQNKNS